MELTEPEGLKRITRALISVSDKTGIEDLRKNWQLKASSSSVLAELPMLCARLALKSAMFPTSPVSPN